MDNFSKVPFAERITPADYVKQMQNQQPTVEGWAQCLATLVNYSSVTVDAAIPYAQALADAAGDKSEIFWQTYNAAIA